MIKVRLEGVLARKGMTLGELAEKVGITLTNMSLLKNSKVRGVRFETLSKICEVLECQPGDILEYIDDK